MPPKEISGNIQKNINNTSRFKHIFCWKQKKKLIKGKDSQKTNPKNKDANLKI